MFVLIREYIGTVWNLTPKNVDNDDRLRVSNKSQGVNTVVVKNIITSSFPH